MKTLLEIKNEIVRKRYNTGLVWDDISLQIQTRLWPEVCRRAQLECARETLKEASNKATAFIDENLKGDCFPVIVKSSITDEGNIKLVE